MDSIDEASVDDPHRRRVFLPCQRLVTFTTCPFRAYYPTDHVPDPAKGGHVSAHVATLLDKDHFTQQRTWKEKGKED
jgi:hypothetical protein